MVRLVLLIFLLPSFSYSQAPFELENRRALKLTDSRLQMLSNKEWRIRKVVTNNRGDITEGFSHISRIKYNPDGTFRSGLFNGTWTILEGKYIKHQIERKAEIRNNFGGSYAVTAVSDTSLVLTKLLTSSQDMKRTIYLTMWPDKRVLNSSFKHQLYYSKLDPDQIDSISRLSSENLFEYNFRFTKDSVFFTTFDSLYRIKRKLQN